MKRIHLLLLVSTFAVACTKGDSPAPGQSPLPNPEGGNTASSTYFIKAKINGTARTFNFNTQAKTAIAAGTSTLSLVATTALSGGEMINLNISFLSGGPAAATTYTESSGGSNYFLWGAYGLSHMTEAWASGGSSTGQEFTLTIATRSDTEITGTFQGAFYKQDLTGRGPTTDFIILTEGQFKLPLQ